MTSAAVHAAYRPRWDALAAEARTHKGEAAVRSSFDPATYLEALDVTEAIDRIIRHLYPDAEQERAA